MAAVLHSMEKATNEAGGEPEDVAIDNKMDDQEPDNSDMEEEEE